MVLNGTCGESYTINSAIVQELKDDNIRDILGSALDSLEEVRCYADKLLAFVASDNLPANKSSAIEIKDMLSQSKAINEQSKEVYDRLRMIGCFLGLS